MPVSATGLNVTPTTAVPNTTISSSAYNNNNNTIIGALNPTFQTLGVAGDTTLGNGAATVDASGNGTLASLAVSGFSVDATGFLHFAVGGTLEGTSYFTGTGSGTYSHGLGTTPKIVLGMAHAVGSQTMGWDSETSTTVHITCGASLAFVAEASRYL